MNYIRLHELITPKTLDDIIGQDHLVGINAPVRNMLVNNRLSSFMLVGPPGIGKTSISQVIASESAHPFIHLNATSLSKKELSEAIGKGSAEEPVLLVIQEIHKLTKVLSEILLPCLEDFSVFLIGTTTESVYHSLPAAILSRCFVYQLKKLSPTAISEHILHTIKNNPNYLAQYDVSLSDETLIRVCEVSGGDMRFALNLVEHLVSSSTPGTNITLPYFEKNYSNYKVSSSGKSSKYDLISALQKSVRNSDASAAVLYLSALLEMGEIETVARRCIVIAAEDCNDPYLTSSIINICDAAVKLGSDQGKYLLSLAVTSMALSPKSNSSYLAINKATALVKSGKDITPPLHLRDAHYSSASELGIKGYCYTHDYPAEHIGAWVNQECMPIGFEDTVIFEPKNIGREKNAVFLNERIKQAKKSTPIR